MAVKRSFDATREGKGLMSRFPFKYQQILEDTQFAVVNASRDRLSRDLYTFRVNGAEAEKKLLTARSAATPSLPEAVGLKQVLIAIGMLTFIIMKFRRYRLTRGSIVESTLFDVLRRMGYGNPLKVIQSKFWVSMALILNVLGEEFVRNAFPRLAKVMWYVEFALNGMQVGIGALPAFGMHLLCDHLVARYGAAGSVASFGVHALFNLSTVGRTFELAELDKAGRLSEAVPPLALEGVRQYVRTVDSALDSQGKQVQLAVEQGKNLYEAFVRTHATAGRVDAKTFATAIPAAAVIQAYTSTTLRGPKQLRGKIRIAVDGVQCSSPEDALSKLDDCVTQDAANVMYPICVTNGLLWEPARNDKNLLVAILHRTHNDPFVGTDKSSTRHKRWYFLALRSVDYGLFSAQIQTIPTLAQCVEIMGKRGRRIEQAHVATESRGENLQLKTNITLKWNETISAQKDMGDFVTMKPRAIVNLDAIYHAQMTQWARAIADVLHELFDGRIHYVAGVPVRIFFASGYNQDKLNQLGQALAEGEIVIAAAGDDSCVGWGVLTRQGMEPFGEADQGQFDHTQDEGPTFLAAGVWLRALGCPAWFVSLLRECCSIAYKVKTKRMVVKGEAEVQMPTGITLTTVMNSVATVLNKVNYVEWLVSHPDEVPDFTELGRDLGFVVKYHGKPDVGELTFLRGWWRLDTQGAYVWLPLPSALLKLGKILRDPVTITHVHKQGKKVQRTSEEAVKVVAWALARCYDGVPRDYPVLGEFLEVMKRCGKRTKIHIEDVIESAAYKPKLGTVTIDRPEAMLAVCRRYGCDRLDIERAERVLRSVRTLPAYVEDPFFETLANVDYA